MKKLSIYLLFIFALIGNAKSSTPCVNKIVYAFQSAPYACTNNYMNVNWALLTHFVFCSITFDVNGNVIPAGGCADPSSALVNMAHSNGVKVIILIWSPDSNAVDNVLADTTKMHTLASGLKNYIQLYNLDGANMDFE